MIYFTSDLHFNHNKDFIYKARGFNSVEEMNEKIIDNFNSVVDYADPVYILGDVVLGDIESGIECLKRLNGRKILIIGNHDSDNKILRYKEEGIFSDIQFGFRMKANKRTHFYLSHYPSLVNNFDDPKKIWNLHGHTHSTEKFEITGHKNYNVGLDAHNCFPVSIETILNDINERKQNVRY